MAVDPRATHIDLVIDQPAPNSQVSLPFDIDGTVDPEQAHISITMTCKPGPIAVSRNGNKWSAKISSANLGACTICVKAVDGFEIVEQCIDVTVVASTPNPNPASP